MKLTSNVEGFISSIEGSMINFLSSRCTNGCIVQIGCFKGRSTGYIVTGKNSHIDAYLIDIKIQEEMLVFASPTVYLLEMNSQDESTLYNIPPIEFLFIDGDHSFAGELKDIELWYPKVIPGGVIMIHDVYPIGDFSPEPDVQRAAFFGLMHKWKELYFDDFMFSPFHRVDTSLIIQKAE